MALIVTFVGILLLFAHGSLGNDFSYNGLHGPQNWGKNYNGCVGKHQSPINIEEHIVTNVSLPSLSFNGLDQPQSTFLLNNGHTVMLKFNNSASATVTGGPLGNDEYIFEQLHFHWGENDNEGSEDLINNHSFAMELHVVFYKKTYNSMDTAVDHSDGLTVLAYFFEASDVDNPNYESIVEILPLVEEVGSSAKLTDPLIMTPILMPEHFALQDYYTYNGSLTTPPCSEVVTWIDFKDPLPLSHKQIAAFRDVRSTDGVKLTHNFRPVQPLEDRIIFRNVPANEIQAAASETAKSQAIPEKSSSPESSASTFSLTLTPLVFTVLPELFNALWISFT